MHHDLGALDTNYNISTDSDLASLLFLTLTSLHVRAEYSWKGPINVGEREREVFVCVWVYDKETSF